MVIYILLFYTILIAIYTPTNRTTALQDEDPEDLAKGKDRIFTTRVVKYILKQHPEWHEVGLAYDSGSSLYTSARLVFPEDSAMNIVGASDADLDFSSTSETPFCKGPRFEEDVTWPGARRPSNKIVIAPVSRIVPPVIGKPRLSMYYILYMVAITTIY